MKPHQAKPTLEEKNQRKSDGSDSIGLIHDIDLEHPIDIKISTEKFQGNHKMYYGMLRRLEGLTLNQSMVKMVNLLDKKDWIEIESLANTLK